MPTSPLITTTMTAPLATLVTTAMTTNITCVNGMRVIVVGPGDCNFVSNAAMVFVIASIILMIWGLFNNIILLIIIFTNGKQMRTLPNIFIANMAFLGILFLVVVSGGNAIVFGQVAFQVEIVKSNSVTGALFFVQAYVSVASFIILILLGFDRYLAIVHPLRSRPYRTKKRALLVNCLVWLVAAVCTIPVFIGGGSQNLFENYKNPTARTSLIIFIILVYVIPVILILLMYVAILKVIFFNPITKQAHGEEQARRWKQQIQVFKSISIVVVTFILLYGYFFAIFLWISVGGHTQVSGRLSNVLLFSAILLFYLNTGLNPLIYALHQRAFRPYVYKLLCPKRFHLNRPTQDALSTTLQNNTGATPATIMTPRTLQNGKDCLYQSNNGRGSTEANTDDIAEVDNGSHRGYLNEGYHGNTNTDGDVTSGHVTGVSSVEHETRSASS